ncbi:hypothetical protein [Paludisphaera rhizosphaerae]|uniref:hypothetical protein n=1 Tax=Paludisphaera rhizosphaerae TaxID=2711216 RepID=UPI0013EC49EE|nr:hypothetical protein [Paludisphaera rhizosphaerae]
MRKPRLRISAMMIFVAVVAFDLSVAPAFLGFPRLGAAIIGVALQVACYLLVRGRGRTFWLGFLVAGSLSLASCFLAFPPHGIRLVTTTTPSGGTLTRGVYDYPGSLMWQAWASYDRLWKPVGQYLAPYALMADPPPAIYFGLMAMEALIESLPHWLIALAGGLVSYAATRRFRRTDRSPVADPPTPVAEAPRDAAVSSELGPTMV